MNDPKKTMNIFDPEEVAPQRFQGYFAENSGVYLSIKRPDGEAKVKKKVKFTRVGHRPVSGIRNVSLPEHLEEVDRVRKELEAREARGEHIEHRENERNKTPLMLRALTFDDD